MNQKMNIASLAVVGLLSLALGQDIWTLRNPLPTVENFNAIAYGKGVYVAVGDMGTIVSSTDGKNWTKRASGSIQIINTIIFANNRFIAGGSGGAILVSLDGISWTTSSSGTQEDIWGISYGKNTFVAVSSSLLSSTSSILTSQDGVTWARKTLSGNSQICVIDYGKDGFVIPNHQPNGFDDSVLISSDAVTWTNYWLKNNYEIFEMAYGNGLFVAVGTASGGDAIFHSSDGINWVVDTLLGYAPHGIAYVNNHFVAVGANDQIATSENGTRWTIVSNGMALNFNAIVWGDNQYVVAGASGAFAASSDGIAWFDNSLGLKATLQGVAGKTGQIIAVGTSGTILSSPNGITWTMQNSGTSENLQGVASSNSFFVAVGSDGNRQVFTSTNAQNWAASTSAYAPLYCAFSQNNGFIVGGGSWNVDCLGQGCASVHGYSVGAIICSHDGINWEVPQTTFKGTVRSICSNGSRYIAVGEYYDLYQGEKNLNNNAGALLTSQDGVSWMSGSPGTNRFLNGVAYGNKQFIAVGATGTIITSPDGDLWMNQTPQTVHDLHAITYANGVFIVVGDNGVILSSSNGVNWTIKNSGTAQSLLGVTFVDTLFIAVGNCGMILTSPASAVGISNSQPTMFVVQNGLTFYNNVVHYTLASSSPVWLKLFDLHGRLVTTLENSRREAGIYSVNVPRFVSPGMFLISLKAGDIKINKIVIVQK